MSDSTEKRGEGARVIDLGSRRREAAEAKGRRCAVTINAYGLRIQALHDGSAVIRTECYTDRQWCDIEWKIPPAMAARIASQIRECQDYAAALARYAGSLASVQPIGTPVAKKRKRCRLTPEGWHGGRRGCVRWRGHEGQHRDASGHAFEVRADAPSEVSRS